MLERRNYIIDKKVPIKFSDKIKAIVSNFFLLIKLRILFYYILSIYFYYLNFNKFPTFLLVAYQDKIIVFGGYNAKMNYSHYNDLHMFDPGKI